ncbi:hypothetical protein BD408DRAFT_388998 [Parasitella parasitica]|nr:hypothetical protein BD408DRAFT_388998 [Parasitella parasitica]
MHQNQYNFQFDVHDPQQQQHEQIMQTSQLLYNHHSSQNSSKTNSGQPSAEETTFKRKQSLERNRLAAYRCRERKKNEQQQMIKQADFLSVQNESLSVMVGDLKSEVIALRELLLAHDSCHCEGVQSFIQRTSSAL